MFERASLKGIALKNQWQPQVRNADVFYTFLLNGFVCIKACLQAR